MSLAAVIASLSSAISWTVQKIEMVLISDGQTVHSRPMRNDMGKCGVGNIRIHSDAIESFDNLQPINSLELEKHVWLQSNVLTNKIWTANCPDSILNIHYPMLKNHLI